MILQFHFRNRQTDTDPTAGKPSNRRGSNATSTSSFSLAKAFTKVHKDDVTDGEAKSLGLNLLYSPSEPQADFIFVHGLGGDSKKTWCKNSIPSQYWPQEWLPQDPAFKNVRIHSYGYDSHYLKGKEDCLNVHHLGKLLLGEMDTSPTLTDTRIPIVAIGHSMGGLVIKKAFILAKNDPAYRDLANRFAAIYFLATPHRGADSAKLLKNILRMAYDRAYITDLGRNSGAVQVINDEFRHLSAGLELWSFYETQNMKWFNAPIVDPESAVLGYREEKQIPMNADHRSICKFESQLDTNYVNLRNALASTVGNITDGLATLGTQQKRHEGKALGEYLGICNILDDEYTMVKEARLKTSCQWIETKTSFKKWRDGKLGENNILLIEGKPATGKSVLAGYIIDQLRQSDSTCCSHYFFKHGDKAKSALGASIRSLAFQMAISNSGIRDVILRIQADGISLKNMDARTIWRILFLQGIFQTHFGSHFWVIDGLDECSNPAAFVDIILSNISASMPLRILITSRDTVNLQPSFSSLSPTIFASLSIQTKDTASDIKLLVESQMENLSIVDSEDQTILIKKILSESKGSFLWTLLVLKELQRCHSKNEVQHVLSEVPRGMESLYKRILETMSREIRGKELAKAILMWAACAIRPMATSELDGALRLDIEDVFPKLEHSIAALCGQLVMVDKFGKILMVHETAREYLLSHDLHSEFAFDEAHAHGRMARICLQYLTGNEMKPPRTSRWRRLPDIQNKRGDFSDYAYIAFSYHLCHADPLTKGLLELTEQFFSSNILTWIEAIANLGDLNQLIRTSKHLRTYLNAVCVERSPLDPRIRDLRQWTADLTRLAAKFANALIASPSAIYSLIPPFCPSGTMIHGVSTHSRRLTVLGASSEKWDDRLFCVNFRQGQPSAICYGESFVATGLSTGAVILYYATSYQEYRVLNHGEPVKIIRFRSRTDFIATCGMKMTKIWDIKSGDIVHNLKSPQNPLDMIFDTNKLIVASHKNYLRCWDLQLNSITERTILWSNCLGPTGTPIRKPPCVVAISTSHQMIAIAYSGEPIVLWDMNEDAYIGTCGKKLSNGQYCHSRVVALAFNPNPSVGLLATAYLDGDLALIDPFTDEQMECFRANCQTLAASPNGRLLAAGAAEGVIHVYEFDTLRLLYRVKSTDSYIKNLSFSRDSLRLADIRGSQCTIWEPASFIRESLNDDSSGTTTTSMVDTIALDATSKITAIAIHPTNNVIICGRDDGRILQYGTRTASLLGPLCNHKSQVRFLMWYKHTNALLSVDVSNKIYLHKFEIASDKCSLIDVEIVFQIQLESDQAIIDVLIVEPAGKFIIATRESDHTYSSNGTEEGNRKYDDAGSMHRWIHHPRSSLHLICMDSTTARIYCWKDWSEVECFPMPGGRDGLQLKSLRFFSTGQNLMAFVEWSEKDASTVTTDTSILDANCLLASNDSPKQNDSIITVVASKQGFKGVARESITCSPKIVEIFHPQFLALARNITHVLGIDETGQLIFLDRSSWVCSIRLNENGPLNDRGTRNTSNVYFRHFFIPYDWFAGRREILCVCTSMQADIIFAQNRGLALIREWIHYAERIGLEELEQIHE